MSIYQSEKEKETILDQMNYKYGFESNKMPIIVFK